MKALTVKQPWAWAIINGGKGVENRVWTTKHRGDLAIHAGVFPGHTYINRALISGYFARPDAEHPVGSDLLTSTILGIVQLAGIHHADECENLHHDPTRPGRYCTPWSMPGVWHWQLTDPRPVRRPLHAKGMLSLWDIPTALVEAALHE